MNSPWIDENDVDDPQPLRTRGIRNFNPARMVSNGSIGGAQALDGILILDNPDCFESEESVMTPLQRIERTDAAAKSQVDYSQQELLPRIDFLPRIVLSPNRLPVFDECPRRQWYETRGDSFRTQSCPLKKVESTGMLTRLIATFGTIFHRFSR